jgi:hypothetical protein
MEPPFTKFIAATYVAGYAPPRATVDPLGFMRTCSTGGGRTLALPSPTAPTQISGMMPQLLHLLSAPPRNVTSSPAVAQSASLMNGETLDRAAVIRTDTAEPARDLTLRSPKGRLTLLATVAASGMASLDATVVNVALPHIGQDFNTSVGSLQWVLTGYLLARRR